MNNVIFVINQFKDAKTYEKTSVIADIDLWKEISVSVCHINFDNCCKYYVLVSYCDLNLQLI